MKRYAAADNFLTRANWIVSQDPDCSNAIRSQLHSNYGKLYAQQGKIDEAQQQLALGMWVFLGGGARLWHSRDWGGALRRVCGDQCIDRRTCLPLSDFLVLRCDTMQCNGMRGRPRPRVGKIARASA